MANLVCGVSSSALGQAWQWRGQNSGFSGENPLEDLIDRILITRGCPRESLSAYRDPKIKNFMPDPSLLCDMDRAAERLAKAIYKKESIVIFGDYDVDGATSSALMIDLLRQLGVNAGYYIPDRVAEGYGPAVQSMRKLAEEGANLVVTVDCGAQAYEALEAAKEAGLDVVVVDHHQCQPQLPEAHAVVNPNRLDEEEGAQYGHLAAVGVAFLLAAALVRHLRQDGYFSDRPEPKLMALLDLVALGTVADVAALHGLNRAFVAQGLKVMAARHRPGIAALLDVAGVSRPPTTYDLGFILGPRINAGGRVGKSDLGVRLLTSLDKNECENLALALNQFNLERRSIEQTVTEAAEGLCEEQVERPVMVVAGEGWHPGVIGIVAGRLKQKYDRPIIVIGIDEEGNGKGSGRSLSGVDLGAAVLSAKQAGLLVNGGGHAMAAGLSIKKDQIEDFSTFISERVQKDVETARANKALLIDEVLSAGGVNLSLIEALEAGGPYGAGWPSPHIVAGPVYAIQTRILKEKHLSVIFKGQDGQSFKAIAFNAVETPITQMVVAAGRDRKLWVAGKIQLNEWNGRKDAQLHIEDIAWA
ncbi:single-stranded-DNA-specific exonuclease RecJ [Zymomonas mobilis subsp. mobilis ZM4 = ATCC 31821]|uniref:Single-stranded-DNA-specific exonuclease RecJ n=1 Tax=Zymomonas mobilis subsp. mobilis (strain ATCC 31821 / ZM4 / CP4) TaxID=264203 RepID=Q5NN55_ZYMMO|nr:single-stranded-DNA-specific exonuclease RecJ [Zymomonas mobilis]AAV89855.2 single-stranded-DNA-specific exonuclease RecJ [Zymomonas mobilis subsp. mobilis ZM4 = ATCC 31821]AVZ26108.1 single-stranded-DNA-specific exonuclease RecJ [Zymomonas mobilis subsp. mobilis]AVZ27999.1 single-stranded-DNA-specific exonuclease RecJ [Zymomonas mobilis subsp. mobilis]AVZ42446.1 single-stranded-DNA-specific exonuclease RecJ [Zymomonas mobilis subsp. mobilis ZM4 = ATCC 31821]UBQ07218.1 single-stranded-DNA-s